MEIVALSGIAILAAILAVMLNAVFVLYDYSMNGLIVLYIRRLHPLVQKYIK